jgi:iron complex outermembrane receptor protein
LIAPRIILPFLVLAAAGALRAEDRLGEVVVTGPAVQDAARATAPTAFATVIDARAAPTQVETLADALADAVGVQVRRFGGLGDFTTVSVRGFSPRQVQVYLDGVPLSRADNETVDLSDLPLDAVDHVEVYRGTTPLRFAQAGPGGVVNVVTRRPGETPVTAASASYGSFDTRKVDVTRSASHDRWSYLVFGHYLGTEGDFSYRDDAGTPDNTADDRTLTRINNDFDLGSLTARLGWRSEAGTAVSLTTDTFGRDRGFPGRGFPQDADARRQTVRHLSRLDATFPAPSGLPLSLEGSTYLLYEWQRFADPLGPVIQLTSDVEEQSVVGGGQLVATAALGTHQMPALLTALSHETFGQRDDVGGPGVQPGRQPDRTRLRGTVAAEDEILLLDERVAIVPGLRWEGFHDEAPPDPRLARGVDTSGTVDRSVWSPRLGVRVEPWPGIAFLGNAGRYERVPSLQELFGASGTIQGNPDLQPETTLNWDVGFRLTAAQLGPVATRPSLEYAYFDNQVDDVIVVVPTSVNLFTSRNVAEARVRGHEVAASVRLWEHIGLVGNYTHQDAVDESDIPFRHGNRLPGRPTHEAYARIELAWDAERPLPLGAVASRLWPGRLWGDANIIADNFLDTANTERVPRRDLFGVGVTLEPIPHWKASLEGRNLGDDQTRDALDFPLPGRSFYATLSWGF